MGSPLHEERGSTRDAAVSTLNRSRKEDKRRSKVISLIGPTASALSRLFLPAEELSACVEEMPRIYLFIQLSDRAMGRNKTEKKARQVNRRYCYLTATPQRSKVSHYSLSLSLFMRMEKIYVKFYTGVQTCCISIYYVG